MQIKNSEILFPNGLKPFKVKTETYNNVTINSSGWVGLDAPVISGYAPLVAMVSDYETAPGLYSCANMPSTGKIYIYGEPNKTLTKVYVTFVFFKTELYEWVHS